MKFLIVAVRDEIRPSIERVPAAESAEIVRYRSAEKALDNLEEIEPDAVFFADRDFPGYRQHFVNRIRNAEQLADTALVVLTGDRMDAESERSARQSGATLVVHEELDRESDIDRLEAVLRRVRRTHYSKHRTRITPNPEDRIGFVFVHPSNETLVTGLVCDISGDGLRFRPFRTELLHGLNAAMMLEGCLLRIGDEIVRCSCRITAVSREMHLSFQQLDGEDRGLLLSYLASKPE